jgi:hypothetical protein
MNSWNNCEAWLAMIKDTKMPFSGGKQFVLTHDGFYYADDPVALQSGKTITEEDFERVIKRCAEDVMIEFERTKPYAVRKTGSYTGKHIIERLHDYYTTNGEFILAVFCSGLFKEPQEWLSVCKGLTGNKKSISLNIVLPIRLKKMRH